MFREQEGNKNELLHKTFLDIIRDEFQEEISRQEILPSKYKNDRGREYPMFELSKGEALQVCMRESKFVRKSIRLWIESLDDSDDVVVHKAFVITHRRLEAAQEQVQLLNNTIKEQAPIVQYAETVLDSNTSHTITTIAKELGVSGQHLNDLLCQKKIQYRQDGHYVLYAAYQNKGYVTTRTHTYTDKQGNTQTSIQTVWTEKGRHWIHQILNRQLGKAQ